MQTPDERAVFLIGGELATAGARVLRSAGTGEDARPSTALGTAVVTSAAKAGTENEAFIAAVNRCATQKQLQPTKLFRAAR